MALSYPLVLPAGLTTQGFRLRRVDTLSPDVGGRLRSASRGPALWEMSASIEGVAPDRGGDAWLAWADALYGSQKHFLASDVHRPFPWAYTELSPGVQRGDWAGFVRAGGGAFDGTVASPNWGVADADKVILYLSTLPVGFTLTRADWVSFLWASAAAPGGVSHAWVRVVEGGSANGSGQLAVQVAPAIPLVIPPSATVRVSQCSCLMRLVPAETSFRDRDLLGQVTGQIVGRQDLIP